MKRDWDQIRRILLAVEASTEEVRSTDIDDREDIVDYHMNLLIDAKLVEGKCVVMRDTIRSCRIQRMTWKGHELLDTIRNQSAWNRIKDAALDKGVSLSFDAIMAIAKGVFS